MTNHTVSEFGSSDCAPLSGDYDGDGKADLTVFDQSTGYWYILPSSTLELSLTPFGSANCIPIQ